MLGVKSLDYNNYYVAFKGNYRKGVHRLRGILENTMVAQEFAGNVGGVSVVLGWPIGHDDKNSAELLALLQGSAVVDQATLTWLSQWYPDFTTDYDTFYGDLERCKAIAGNALMFRAVAACPIGIGKLAVTLSGGDCRLYQDITAVAASSTAMAAVIASSTARNALVASSTARAALKASPLAVERTGWSSSWNNSGQTVNIRGLLLYTTSGNTDNAFTVLKIDQTVLTTDCQTRNASIQNSTAYKDWLEAYPNNSWILSSLTVATAYPATAKIKYIPC